MAVQKKTYTRAINVIPSDNNDIPNPALQLLSGQSFVGAPGSFLLETIINLELYGIKPGDIVYNTSQDLAATIVSYPIANVTIELNADIFTSAGLDFVIYAGTQNDASKGGCVIYSGSGGNFIADTLGGDQISFGGIPSGQIFPVQVKKVYLTGIGAGPLVALW
jgi:hypothetical protein